MSSNDYRLQGESVPDYADVFTLKEFKSHCVTGFFIDYDGSGYYVKDDIMYGSVYCADIAAGKIDDRYTHVAWFNK